MFSLKETPYNKILNSETMRERMTLLAQFSADEVQKIQTVLLMEIIDELKAE